MFIHTAPGTLAGYMVREGASLEEEGRGSGASATTGGFGSPAMGDGGLWRRLTRRLSGSSGSTASPGAWRV